MNIHERNPDIATRALELSSKGASHRDIARATGIAANTLRKHYGEELRRGAAEANIAVANKLYAEAMGGNVTAMIFFLKARAGWSDRPDLPTEDEWKAIHAMREHGCDGRDLAAFLSREAERLNPKAGVAAALATAADTRRH